MSGSARVPVPKKTTKQNGKKGTKVKATYRKGARKAKGATKGGARVSSSAERVEENIRVEIIRGRTERKPGEHRAEAGLRYEIKNSFRGRVRIASRLFLRNRELLGQMRGYLLSLAGITRVDCNPRCGSITIRYDSVILNQGEVLTGIRKMSPADLAEWQPPPESEEKGDQDGKEGGGLKDAGGAVELEVVTRKPSYLERNADLHSSKLGYKVQHVMDGRVRVAVPILASYDELTRSMEIRLSEEQGVTEIQVNVRCGSFVIKHDTEMVKSDDLLQALDRITLRELIELNNELPVLVKEEFEISKGYLRLATAGVGLSVVFGAVPVLALPTVYPLLFYIC